MTWSYSGSPADSLLNQVRFLLGDTNSKDPQLADEEIAFLLNIENRNSLRAAARGADTLAAKYARQSNKKVGDMLLDGTTKMDHYLKLAKSLWGTFYARTVSPYAGGISVGDKTTNAQDSDRAPSAVTRDLMKYPLISTFSNNPEDLLV